MMARKQTTPLDLMSICEDIDQWPQSWAGFPHDVPVGDKLVELFKDFLNQQIDNGRAKSTIKRHADYLWVLGGEIIREICNDDEDDDAYSLSGKTLLLQYIGDEGGPYWADAPNEQELVAYDSVCRLLYKWMIQSDA